MMNISDAMEALLAHQRIYRKSWLIEWTGGAYAPYVMMAKQPALEYSYEELKRGYSLEGNKVECESIPCKFDLINNKIDVWTPAYDDWLAEDWVHEGDKDYKTHKEKIKEIEHMVKTELEKTSMVGTELVDTDI
jgi:hypothetical protein